MATVKTVYTGNFVASGGPNFSATIPSSIDMSKSILFFDYAVSPAATAVSNTSMFYCGQIIDSNTIEFRCNAATSGCEIFWKVVEFTNGVTVQRNTFDTLSATSTNHTINAVDISKSFTILTIYPYNSTSTIDRDELIYPTLTTTTNLSISSLGAGPSNQQYCYQVISYDDCVVTTITATLPAANIFTSASTGLTLTPNKNMLIGHFAAADTNLVARECPVYYLSGNDIYFQTFSGTSVDMFCSIQVIQFTDNTKVYTQFNEITNAVSTFTGTLSTAININKSIPFQHKVFHTWGSNGATIAVNRGLFYSSITSSVQYIIKRTVNGNTAYHSIDIVEFGVDTGYLDRSYMRGVLRGILVGT